MITKAAFEEMLSVYNKEEAVLDAKIEKAQVQLERLLAKKTEMYLKKPTQRMVIEALAEDLSEHFKMPYEILPGNMSEMIIHLSKSLDRPDKKGRAADYALILRMDPDWISYDAGETQIVFDRDSITGATTIRMGTIFKPLPEDFKKIIKLVKKIERSN